MREESIYNSNIILCAIVDTLLEKGSSVAVARGEYTNVDLRADFHSAYLHQKNAARKFADAFIGDIPDSGDWYLRGRSKHFSHRKPYLVSEDHAITFDFLRRRTIFQVKDLSLVMSDFDYDKDKRPVVWELAMAGDYRTTGITTKDMACKPQWPVNVDADDGISCIFKDISSNIDLNAVADAEGLLQITSLLADAIQRNPVSAMAWILQYYYIYPVSYVFSVDKLDKGLISVKKADFSKNIPQIQNVSRDGNKITITCSDGAAFGLRLYTTGKTSHSLSRVTVDLFLKKGPYQKKKYTV